MPKVTETPLLSFSFQMTNSEGNESSPQKSFLSQKVDSSILSFCMFAFIY